MCHDTVVVLAGGATDEDASVLMFEQTEMHQTGAMEADDEVLKVETELREFDELLARSEQRRKQHRDRQWRGRE